MMPTRIITNDHWQRIVQVLDMTDETGAVFGLTGEETEAHRLAFRAAATMGGDAFLAAVEREKLTLAGDGLSAAERLRLQARQIVALAIEEFFIGEALASFDGPRQ